MAMSKPTKEVSVGSTYEVSFVDPRNLEESFEEIIEGVEDVDVVGTGVKFYDAEGNLLFAMWYPVSIKLLDSQKVVH